MVANDRAAYQTGFLRIPNLTPVASTSYSQKEEANSMCGICEILEFDKTSASTDEIAAMSRMLAPRGPDDDGMHLDGSLGFGHRRLRSLSRDMPAERALFLCNITNN